MGKSPSQTPDGLWSSPHRFRRSARPGVSASPRTDVSVRDRRRIVGPGRPRVRPTRCALSDDLALQQELAVLLQRGLCLPHLSPSIGLLASGSPIRRCALKWWARGDLRSLPATSSPSPSRGHRGYRQHPLPRRLAKAAGQITQVASAPGCRPPFRGLACVEAWQRQAVEALASCEPRRDNRLDGYRRWSMGTAASSEHPRNQAFWLLEVGH